MWCLQSTAPGLSYYGTYRRMSGCSVCDLRLQIRAAYSVPCARRMCWNLPWMQRVCLFGSARSKLDPLQTQLRNLSFRICNPLRGIGVPGRATRRFSACEISKSRRYLGERNLDVIWNPPKKTGSASRCRKRDRLKFPTDRPSAAPAMTALSMWFGSAIGVSVLTALYAW